MRHGKMSIIDPGRCAVSDGLQLEELPAACGRLVHSRLNRYLIRSVIPPSVDLGCGLWGDVRWWVDWGRRCSNGADCRGEGWFVRLDAGGEELVRQLGRDELL
jgi:hypothetical protein